MWKTLSQANRSFRSFKIVNCSNLNNRKSNQVLAENLFLTKRLQSTIQSQQNQNLKNIPNKNGPSPTSNQPKQDSSFKKLLIIFTGGALAYYTISYYFENRKGNANKLEINYDSKNLPGRVKPSKSFNRGKNPGNIKITLYQYVTCPFCCKVRAYLDYYGYSYDIIEVNSLNKAQLDWSGYKRVPTLAIQLPSKSNPDEYDPDILQLNESSVIVSALETFRLDSNTPLSQVIKFFQPIEVDSKEDFANKYFVMLHSDKMTDGKDANERKDEREWRKWVDSKFIHVISPNVYRTFNETLTAFDWYDQVGDWKSNFSSFQRSCIKYIGSAVMYILSKSLKKKYNLKEDVRISMYDFCNEWVNSLNGTFRGGSKPNLADLALYGAISSYQGCAAFEDMMTQSKIKNWFESCKDHVENSKGSFYLNNPSQLSDNEVKKNQQNETKKTKRFYIF